MKRCLNDKFRGEVMEQKYVTSYFITNKQIYYVINDYYVINENYVTHEFLIFSLIR